MKPNLSYYRSRGGAELDLILKVDNKIIGIECTTSIDISPYKLRGMKSFLQTYKDAVRYIIAPVQEGYSIDKNIIVIPWNGIG